MTKKLTALLCLIAVILALVSCAGVSDEAKDLHVTGGEDPLYNASGVHTDSTFVVTTSPSITDEIPEPIQPDTDENGTYMLSGANDLIWLSYYVNYHNELIDETFRVRLVNDVDLSSVSQWMPIGMNGSCMFKGTFDGGGHTISGLRMGSRDKSAGNYAALFGITLNARITDLTVSDFVIYGDNFVSGICASSGGVIENCVSDVILNGKTNLGAVCGFNSGTIRNCESRGEINGSDNMIGGICGYLFNATVSRCNNNAKVTGQTCVGGIAGYVDKGFIENSANAAQISASSYAGGICGRCDADNSYIYSDEISSLVYNGSNSADNGIIIRCENTGDVSAATMHAGGISGYSNSYIAFCTNSANVDSRTLAAGISAESHNGAFYGVTNSGSVLTEDGYAAGIVAVTYSPVVLALNTGDIVSGGSNAGGICIDATTTDIVSCLCAGSVKAQEMVSGVCCITRGRIIGCAFLSKAEYSDKQSASAILTQANGEGVVVLDSFYYKNAAPSVIPSALGNDSCRQINQNYVDSGNLAYSMSAFVDGGSAFWGFDLMNPSKLPIITEDTQIKVYKVTKYSRCDKSGNSEQVLSNSESDIVPEHAYRNGICTVCKAQEPEQSDS